MKRRISRIVCLILLTYPLLLPLTVSEAKADTRITLTIAGGSVACGVYFFLLFTFRSSLAMQPYQTESTALLNHDPAGWQINYPSLNFTNDEHLGRSPSGDSLEAAQMELLKFTF